MPKKTLAPKTPAPKPAAARKSKVTKPAAKKPAARKVEPPKPEAARAEALEQSREFSFMKLKGETAELLPWVKGENGTQCYYKLKHGERSAFLYAGENFFQEAELHKKLMRLVNQGWELEGELTVTFKGEEQEDLEKLMPTELLVLEVGSALLPLLDQSQGAPLLQKIADLRKELADNLGVILPGIKVRDNLKLPPNAYMLVLKGTPLAGGEIYLGKLLAVGNLEALSQFKGWSTVEPCYRMTAKWIDPQDKHLADKSQCVLIAPFNVLLTHVNSILFHHAKEFLGLQEFAFMLQKLGGSHPVLVDDFLGDLNKMRKARRVLLNLLQENVPVKDLITIIEVLGEHMEELHRTDLVTEAVRMALRRQICWRLLDSDGKIKALVLSNRMEEVLQNSLRESEQGLYLNLNSQDIDLILQQVKAALEESPANVIFTEPATRIYFRHIIENAFPQINVLSTLEIAPGIKVEIGKEIDVP